MLTKEEYADGVRYMLKSLADAGFYLTEEEKERIEVADFGLGKVKEIGLQLFTYVNTDRCCAKEMVLRPFQTCPEHTHRDGREDGSLVQGKEETFRVRRGLCYLYVDGEGDKATIKAKLPETAVTVFHEIVLREGEQYTMYPNTRHWFQAGAEGAVISEFSTHSNDETDDFEDARIRRIPEVEKICL